MNVGVRTKSYIQGFIDQNFEIDQLSPQAKADPYFRGYIPSVLASLMGTFSLGFLTISVFNQKLGLQIILPLIFLQIFLLVSSYAKEIQTRRYAVEKNPEIPLQVSFESGIFFKGLLAFMFVVMASFSKVPAFILMICFLMAPMNFLGVCLAIGVGYQFLGIDSQLMGQAFSIGIGALLVFNSFKILITVRNSAGGIVTALMLMAFGFFASLFQLLSGV